MPADLYGANLRRYRALELLIAREWRSLTDDLDASWARIGPRVALLVANAQVGAAYDGALAMHQTLVEAGTPVAPEGIIIPEAWAGWTDQGNPLDSLLGSVNATMRSATASTFAERRSIGLQWLQQAAREQVGAASRGASQVAVAARPGCGFTRMVNPPCCKDCALQAGRWFRWNTGFARHPHCFPAGVVISGPALEAATRRWYEGELVILATASGEHLTVTGNHPVLTRAGWLPAHLIREGDEVVRSTRPEGATALVVPNHDQVPSLIEDVWGALGVRGSDRMPTTAEDFHGDGRDGEVDVVYADRALWRSLHTPFGQHVGQESFAAGVELAERLLDERVPQLLNLGDSARAGGPIGRGSLGLPFLEGHGGVPRLACFAHTAALSTVLREDAPDGPTAHAVLLGESVLGGPREVGGHDLLLGEGAPIARWDAPGGPFSMETRDGYAARGADLMQRLAGQVELDRVVESRSVDFSGHVYSVTSSEGWHVANSLIVSNCDCVHVPVYGDSIPDGYVDDVPVDQIHDLSDAERRAIADGADLSQVVNAARGARGHLTTEGATKRGAAGWHMGARGNTPVRRLTVDAIYAKGGSREQVLQRLADNGYMVGEIRGKTYEGYGQMGRGGTRVGAREAILRARRTGVRDPGSIYTMTAAERRAFDRALAAQTQTT